MFIGNGMETYGTFGIIIELRWVHYLVIPYDSTTCWRDLKHHAIEPVFDFSQLEEACIFAVVDVFDFGPSFKLLQYLAEAYCGCAGGKQFGSCKPRSLTLNREA